MDTSGGDDDGSRDTIEHVMEPEAFAAEGDEEEKKRHDDGPSDSANLFEEIGPALVSSVQAYGLADLREFARRNDGQIKGDPNQVNKALTLPIGSMELLDVFFR